VYARFRGQRAGGVTQHFNQLPRVPTWTRDDAHHVSMNFTRPRHVLENRRAQTVPNNKTKLSKAAMSSVGNGSLGGFSVVIRLGPCRIADIEVPDCTVGGCDFGVTMGG